MTGSEKFTWGIVLNVSGSLLFLGGLGLSATLIGACLGLPMAIAGLPLLIWGVVWIFQGRNQKAQEVITAGIRDGIQAVVSSQTPRGPELAIVPSTAPELETERSPQPELLPRPGAEITAESSEPREERAQDHWDSSGATIT